MRGGGEAGQVGGMEGLVFGVLVFVFGTLLVANAWGVIDAKLATTAAAREAARTYVESSSGTDAEVRREAQAAAFDAITAHGRQQDRSRVEFPDEPFTRCRRVVIGVSYEVPLVAIPLFGQFGDGITVRARHSELVDPYRSGVPGTAACG